MNPQFEEQLRMLRARQERLREALQALEEDLERLHKAASEEKSGYPQTRVGPPPLPQPRTLPQASFAEPLPAASPKPFPAQPPPIPPAARPLSLTSAEEKTASPASAATIPPIQAGPPSPPETLEFRLVQVWFVRIAVVVFLTALVLLGNYAYQEWISNFGPFARAMALAALSAGVLATGVVMEKRLENLRQFGRVLMAGGFAGLYYTAYASHFVPRLHWIESPVAAGILLIALAGGLVWLAQQKQSQTLAVLGIALAWYTCVINPVGWFTLGSNLVLSVAAVFFLLRNRWEGLSCALLPAVYGAYAYWQALRPDATAPQEAWLGCLFCTTYWSAFTIPIFFPGKQPLTGSAKIWLLAANNFAWFGLTAWTLPNNGAAGDVLWLWSGIAGVLLIALGLCARHYLPSEPLIAHIYRIQGVALLTLAVFIHWQGVERALILAVGGLMLQAGVRAGASPLLLKAGLAVTLLAGILGLEAVSREGREGTPLTGAFLSGLFLLQALLHRPLAFGTDWKQKGDKLLPAPAFYMCLAILTGIATVIQCLPETGQPLVFGAAALACIAVGVGLAAPEAAFLGQLFLLAGHGCWLLADEPAPWWSPLGILAATLACSFWWPRQRRFVLDSTLEALGQALLAFLVAATAFHWFDSDLGMTREGWMVAGGWLTLMFLLYGLAVSNGWLIAFGQFFLAVSVCAFLIELSVMPEGKLPKTSASLYPLGFTLILSIAARELHGPKGEGLSAFSRNAFGLIAQTYRFGTMAMLLLWTFRYVAPVHQIWFLGTASLIAMLWARFQFEAPRAGFSLALAALALVRLLFGLPSSQENSPLHALGLAALFLMIEAGLKKLPIGRQRLVERIALLSVLFALFIYLTRCSGSTPYATTLAWTLLAFASFVPGLLLRERIYRWFGLGLLAIILLRVVLIDLWGLGTLLRIVSLMALAGVLIGLGYVYNRYGDRVKKFL